MGVLITIALYLVRAQAIAKKVRRCHASLGR
jgi:hypothetical protein